MRIFLPEVERWQFARYTLRSREFETEGMDGGGREKS